MGQATADPCPADSNFNAGAGTARVAKTTPIEFLNQVKTETKKVVWPTRRETVMTGVMVVVMTTILAIFFLAVDSFFETLVRTLLSFAK
nr:preprotein translocase subunit SecE [Sphingomonas yabuuchiae]